MKYSCRLFVMIVVCGFSLSASAQKTLPDFTVRALTKDKIQISWNNPYPDCIQLAIQRSSDSTKNFRTIFSSLSPELSTNGYVDSRPFPGNKAYYRIFYVLKGGGWYFSHTVPVSVSREAADVVTPKPPIIISNKLVSIYIRKRVVQQFTEAEYRAFRDSINHQTNDGLKRINDKAIEWIPRPPRSKQSNIYVFRPYYPPIELDKKRFEIFRDSIRNSTYDTLYAFDSWHHQLKKFVPKNTEFVFIYRNDSLQVQLPLYRFKKFKDSIAFNTKDTLFVVDYNRAEIHSYVPKYVWKPSIYVYTNRSGYVTINLPLVKRHKYHIIFYEADGSELFRINSIKDPELILDKTDFVHAGWFNFELYEDDKLKEKNKFMLTRN